MRRKLGYRSALSRSMTKRFHRCHHLRQKGPLRIFLSQRDDSLFCLLACGMPQKSRYLIHFKTRTTALARSIRKTQNIEPGSTYSKDLSYSRGLPSGIHPFRLQLPIQVLGQRPGHILKQVFIEISLKSAGYETRSLTQNDHHLGCIHRQPQRLRTRRK